MLVIYGKTEEPDGGPTVLTKGTVFVWPIIQDYDFLDLKLHRLDLYQENLAKDRKKIVINGWLSFRISKEKMLARNAAERLLARGHEEIRVIAQNIMEARIRGLVSEKDFSEIMENRITFVSDLEKSINEQLNKVGLFIENSSLYLK